MSYFKSQTRDFLISMFDSITKEGNIGGAENDIFCLRQKTKELRKTANHIGDSIDVHTSDTPGLKSPLQQVLDRLFNLIDNSGYFERDPSNDFWTGLREEIKACLDIMDKPAPESKTTQQIRIQGLVEAAKGVVHIFRKDPCLSTSDDKDKAAVQRLADEYDLLTGAVKDDRSQDDWRVIAKAAQAREEQLKLENRSLRKKLEGLQVTTKERVGDI